MMNSVLPRVLIVSRRTVRKNKFIDFVGEYHLDLLVQYGAVPVIVPRVAGVHLLLDSLEPIHGVLLCEGDDIDPSLYEQDQEEEDQQEEEEEEEGFTPLSSGDPEEVKKQHCSDTGIDKHKDVIELQLARRCLLKNIPFLGICRGCQMLNVASGGSLYQDVDRERARQGRTLIKHMKYYDDYDGHMHPINVVQGTPMHDWFSGSFQEASPREPLQLNVNSYHHQGIKHLATRFKPMAFSPCGLIEAFYDPDVFCPKKGKFMVGLQFHPEPMQQHKERKDSDNSFTDSKSMMFDYPGCAYIYQDFAKAVNEYQKKSIHLKRKDIEKVTCDIDKPEVIDNSHGKLLKQTRPVNPDRTMKARLMLEKLETHELCDLQDLYSVMMVHVLEILESRRVEDDA